MSKPLLCRLGMHKRYMFSTHYYQDWRGMSVMLPLSQFEQCKCCDHKVKVRDY